LGGLDEFTLLAAFVGAFEEETDAVVIPALPFGVEEGEGSGVTRAASLAGAAPSMRKSTASEQMVVIGRSFVT